MRTSLSWALWWSAVPLAKYFNSPLPRYVDHTQPEGMSDSVRNDAFPYALQAA